MGIHKISIRVRLLHTFVKILVLACPIWQLLSSNPQKAGPLSNQTKTNAMSKLLERD